MAFKIVNLATLQPPCTATRDQIVSTAYLLGLDISFMEAGGGFINVSGDPDAIQNFIVAIQHPAIDYDKNQKGDLDDTM